MSGAPNSAQTTTSPSSGPSTTSTQSTQDGVQARTTLAVARVHSNNPLYDTDDDLSDAPQSPVFPTFSTSTDLGPAPPSDSDSDLSDAIDNPVWPEYPKASPSRPRCTPSRPLCVESDCPVRKAVRRHYQGPYLHRGKPPRTNETLFDDSNPPPHVWDSWMKIQAMDPRGTVEDDYNVLAFLRYHVDNPNSSFMGLLSIS